LTAFYFFYTIKLRCFLTDILRMRFSGKKIFLGGFIAVLLVGIPLTVYLLQQQQEVRSHAEKSTNISFAPDSSQTTPLQKNVGDQIPLDITINPGKNLVSFVKLEIQYDPDKLATDSANPFQANSVVFPSVLEGPIYSPGKISVTLSVGPDPTKAIQTTVKAGTLTLKAIANTPAGTPTVVTYGAATQVLSLGSNDQASENVLSSPIPAYINIGGSTPYPSGDIPTAVPSGGEPTPTYAAVPTTPLDQPTVTPVPTDVVPSLTPEASVTPTASGSGKNGGPNVAPVCNNLTLDRSATGDAPYSITFGANGSDSDGTISKVTFNFGDGQVSDVTQAGGIGTATVTNAQVSHTYNNPGTYQASAVFTDSGDAVSAADNCTQTITINTPGSSGGSSVVVSSQSAVPTVPPTGSTEVAIGIGFVSLLLVIGGSLLFFIL
jgi:hypothetical protein